MKSWLKESKRYLLFNLILNDNTITCCTICAGDDLYQ